VPIEERVLGPEHPRTMTARNELARWTGQAGNPAAARDLLVQLLPARERVSGPEHPDTLLTRQPCPPD
jgi:Tetratricopeptide repeat